MVALGSPEQGSGLRELQRGIFGAYKGGIICCTPSSWPPTSLYSVCGSDCITAVANDDSFPSSPHNPLPPTRLVCNTERSGMAKRGSCHGSSHRRRKTSALPLGTQVTLETRTLRDQWTVLKSVVIFFGTSAPSRLHRRSDSCRHTCSC